MQNVLQSQFNYDVFKSAYDKDAGFKELIKNFDAEKITFSDGSAVDDMPTADAKGDDTVANMAKSATNADSGL